MDSLRRTSLISVSLLLLVCWAGVAQVAVDRARVLVLPVQNLTGRPPNDSIAATTTSTMSLTLQLIGRYDLVATEGLTSADALRLTVDGLDRLAEDRGADSIIFGTVTLGPTGELLFAVSVFDRAAGEITVEARSRADSLFEVFDAADDLVADAVSGFSGERIGFGNVQVRTTESGGDFRLYLDGTLVGENVVSMDRVLIGERLVEIRQVRSGVEVTIHQEMLTIRERQVATVSFTLPVLLPEEIARERALREAVAWRLEAGFDPNGAAHLLAELEQVYSQLPAGFPGGSEEIPFYRDRLTLVEAMQQLVLLDLEELARDSRPPVQLLAAVRTPWQLIFEQYRRTELAAAMSPPPAEVPEYRFTPRQRRELVEREIARNVEVLTALLTLERAAVENARQVDLIDGYNQLIRGLRTSSLYYNAFAWPSEITRSGNAVLDYQRALQRRRPAWHWVAGALGAGALGYAGYVQFSDVLPNLENRISDTISRYEASDDLDEIVDLRRTLDFDVTRLNLLQATGAAGLAVGATLVTTAVIGRVVAATRPGRVWRRYRDNPFLDRWTAAGLEYRQRDPERTGPPTLLVLGREETFSSGGKTYTTPQILTASGSGWEIEHVTGSGRIVTAVTRGADGQPVYSYDDDVDGPGTYVVAANPGMQILYLGGPQ